MFKGLKVAVVVVVGVLLVMVPSTMQLRVDHPLHGVVSSINDKYGPFLGLVLSVPADEKTLLDSGYFVPSSSTPYVNIAGRQINIGKFKGVNTVYVVASSPLALVSSTVQILVDTFGLTGIIDYGSAATVSDSVAIADVAVLSATSYTGYWNWQNWERPLEHADLPSLSFGDFNYPTPGDNKLGSVKYQSVRQYTPTSSKNFTFWFPVTHQWLQIASELKDIPLENCLNESICVSHKPKVVPGVKGSSSDVLLGNEAYGNFLKEKFDVATVDRKSAATVSTAIANGILHVVFRAASNRPGVPYDPKVAALAAKNSLKVAAAFAERIDNNQKAYMISYY